MIRAILTAALIATSTDPAAAQQKPESDVVVTGRRDAQTRAEAIKALTRTISRRSDDQLARFSDPVCLRVVGFAAQYPQTVERRIIEVARIAGAAVASAPCTGNLTVIMVDDGRQVLRALRRVRPALFARLDKAEREHLLDQAGPTRVVTFTEIRGRDGTRLAAPSYNGALGEFSTLLVHSASIVNPATRQDIAGAIVLIDRRAALGKTLRQLADYAAMRALAKTREADATDDSILALFAGGSTAPAAQLTDFDRAYLTALYRGPAERNFGTRINDIGHGIIKSGAEPRR